MENKDASRILLVLAFFAIYFVWGTTYLANIFALKGFKPFIVSCLRYLTAGLVLVLWAWFKNLAMPDMKSIRVLSVSGILMLVGGSGLVVYAEQYINSGFAAVILATEPLWFVLLDKKRWKEYFSSYKVIVGLATGFAGIALFAHFTPQDMVPGVNGSGKLLGTVIALASAVLWVTGALYADRKLKSGSSNITNSGIQLISAGIFSACLALLFGEWGSFHPQNIPLTAYGGLLYLIIMGSLIAYMAFTWLVKVQPPAIVSTHTYINPIVAVLMGWLIAAEKVNKLQIISLVVVLAGVLLTQVRRKTAA